MAKKKAMKKSVAASVKKPNVKKQSHEKSNEKISSPKKSPKASPFAPTTGRRTFSFPNGEKYSHLLKHHTKVDVADDEMKLKEDVLLDRFENELQNEYSIIFDLLPSTDSSSTNNAASNSVVDEMKALMKPRTEKSIVILDDTSDLSDSDDANVNDEDKFIDEDSDDFSIDSDMFGFDMVPTGADGKPIGENDNIDGNTNASENAEKAETPEEKRVKLLEFCGMVDGNKSHESALLTNAGDNCSTNDFNLFAKMFRTYGRHASDLDSFFELAFDKYMARLNQKRNAILEAVKGGTFFTEERAELIEYRLECYKHAIKDGLELEYGSEEIREVLGKDTAKLTFDVTEYSLLELLHNKYTDDNSSINIFDPYGEEEEADKDFGVDDDGENDCMDWLRGETHGDDDLNAKSSEDDASPVANAPKNVEPVKNVEQCTTTEMGAKIAAMIDLDILPLLSEASSEELPDLFEDLLNELQQIVDNDSSNQAKINNELASLKEVFNQTKKLYGPKIKNSMLSKSAKKRFNSIVNQLPLKIRKLEELQDSVEATKAGNASKKEDTDLSAAHLAVIMRRALKEKTGKKENSVKRGELKDLIVTAFEKDGIQPANATLGYYLADQMVEKNVLETKKRVMIPISKHMKSNATGDEKVLLVVKSKAPALNKLAAKKLEKKNERKELRQKGKAAKVRATNSKTSKTGAGASTRVIKVGLKK